MWLAEAADSPRGDAESTPLPFGQPQESSTPVRGGGDSSAALQSQAADTQG